jgi:acyl-CoA dehydrogenase
MSGFGLTAGQAALAAEVRDIAARELRPVAEAGTPGRVNRDLIKALGRRGLLARLFPGVAEADDAAAGAGGARPGGGGDQRRGVSVTSLCLLREALATECTEAETALALQGLGSYPVLQSGTPRQVSRWLPAVAAGDAVPSFALSEPGAGSDAAALSLTAEPDGNGWRLTGEKTWISNAPEADFYTVFARTTPGAGGRGVSAFLVPADRPGLTGEHIDMLSPHPIGTLAFDRVPVTASDLIGERDQGFAVAMRTLEKFRPSVGAFAVGMAQAALEAALAHAESRTAFGGPLADQQAVAHLLAEMATRTEAARLLVYSAAAALDDSGVSSLSEPGAATPGSPGAMLSAGPRAAAAPANSGTPTAARSAMAKLFATETAQFVVDAAVQIHGARALRRGHLLEHLYREVRAPRIYEGATEVQRTVITRALRRERQKLSE